MNTNVSRFIQIAVQVTACLFVLAYTCVTAACQQSDVVMYEVVGTAPMADIQITNPSGGSEEYNDAGLPWRFSYEGFSDGQAYLYAHNNTEEGSITVNIYVNGQLVRTATSTGPYVTAVTYWDR